MPLFHFTVKDNEGHTSRVCVEAQRFSHYVGGVRFWFALHRPHLQPFGALTVSHWASGLRICTVGHTRQAAYMDNKAAARRELDDIAARVGAAVMADKLRAAEREAEAQKVAA